MEDPEALKTGDPKHRSSAVGCNVVGLILLLIALAVFAVAAWINNPDDSPDPSSTGVPPTAPTVPTR